MKTTGRSNRKKESKDALCRPTIFRVKEDKTHTQGNQRWLVISSGNGELRRFVSHLKEIGSKYLYNKIKTISEHISVRRC